MYEREHFTSHVGDGPSTSDLHGVHLYQPQDLLDQEHGCEQDTAMEQGDSVTALDYAIDRRAHDQGADQSTRRGDQDHDHGGPEQQPIRLQVAPQALRQARVIGLSEAFFFVKCLQDALGALPVRASALGARRARAIAAVSDR